jgi:hypothetical protein
MYVVDTGRLSTINQVLLENDKWGDNYGQFVLPLPRTKQRKEAFSSTCRGSCERGNLRRERDGGIANRWKSKGKRCGIELFRVIWWQRYTYM